MAYQLDFNYDPTILQPETAFTSESGTLSNGMTVTVNNSTAGRSRVAVFGTTAMNGQGILINLRFSVIGKGGEVSPLTWTSFFFNEGNPVSTSENGQVTVLIPTSANVSVGGRISTANGRGIRNVAVTIIDAQGRTRTVTTGTFGYYRFDDVSPGTAVLSVTSKRFSFENPTRTINVTDNVSNINWTAIE